MMHCCALTSPDVQGPMQLQCISFQAKYDIYAIVMFRLHNSHTLWLNSIKIWAVITWALKMCVRCGISVVTVNAFVQTKFIWTRLQIMCKFYEHIFMVKHGSFIVLLQDHSFKWCMSFHKKWVILLAKIMVVAIHQPLVLFHFRESFYGVHWWNHKREKSGKYLPMNIIP